MRFSDDFLAELKACLRLSDIVGQQVKLKRQGRSLVGLSPFNQEKTPSFYVHDDKQFYKCFSSGKSGDIISFVQETQRLSFADAVAYLADQAGIDLPKQNYSPEEDAQREQNQRLQKWTQRAAQYFSEQLHAAKGVTARNYLLGRGLDAEAWVRHGLGYAPEGWRNLLEHLTQMGAKRQDLIAAGLIVEKVDGGEPYDRFRNRLIFPIENASGQIVAFGGRALDNESKPKYLNSSDIPIFHKGRTLYRYTKAREAYGRTLHNGLIVCEGYMDAIALTEAGFGHTVAPLGTALTEPQLQMLWRVGSEPILCFDGDNAGLQAAYSALDRALPFFDARHSLFFALLDNGMDPDDVIRQHGTNAMAQVLEKAVSAAELLWRRETNRENIDTPERRVALKNRLEAAISVIKDSHTKRAYTQDIQSRIRQFYYENDRNKQKKPGFNQSMGSKPLGKETNLRGLGLLIRAIDQSALFEQGYERLARARFPDKEVSAIQKAMFDIFESHGALDRNILTHHLRYIGHNQAARLLDNYPKTGASMFENMESQTWLTALEHYIAIDNLFDPSHDMDIAKNDSAFGEVEDFASRLRRHKQRVAERHALRTEIYEASDEESKH